MTTPREPAPGIRADLPWMLAIIAGVSAGFHLWKAPPFVPLLRDEFGISLADAGLLIGVVQLAGVLGGLAFGILIEAVGVRRSLLIGLGTLAVASIAGGFATGFGGMLALRALESFGYMLTVVAAPALVRRSAEGRRLTAAMGWWASYQGISSGAALAIAALLAGQLTRQAWWWTLGGFSALVAVAIVVAVAPDPPQPVRRSAREVLGAIGRTVRAAAPWLVGVTFTAYALGWIAVLSFLPTVYDAAGVDARTAGLITAVASAANIAGALGGARLLRRGAPPRRLVWTGMAGMAVLGWAFFALELPFGVAIGTVIAFSAIGGLVPAVLTRLAVETAPPDGSVPVALGLVQQLANAGMFVGPVVAGAVTDFTGDWQSTWWINVAVAVVAGALIVAATSHRFGVRARFGER